ncbi:MAG: retropepsin-like aspartic protease [Agrobacterium tumefaciens]
MMVSFCGAVSWCCGFRLSSGGVHVQLGCAYSENRSFAWILRNATNVGAKAGGQQSGGLEKSCRSASDPAADVVQQSDPLHVFQMIRSLRFLLWLLVCSAIAAQAIMLPSLAFAKPAGHLAAEQTNRTLTFKQEVGKIASSVFDDSKGVIVFEVSVNDRKVWALLDSATSNSIIDTKLARDLDLDLTAANSRAQTRLAVIESLIVHKVTLEVPGQFSLNGAFNSVDLSGISKALNKEISVVIGLDVIKVAAIYIDPPSKRIIFSQSGSIKFPSPNVARIPVSDGRIRGLIRGKEASFGVDLGNNEGLVISESSWSAFIPKDAPTTTKTSIDGSGQSYQSIATSGVDFRVGEVEAIASARRVPPTKQGVDAFIGYAFFSGRRTVFDYAGGEIIILLD